jgi:hypothetical protein
MLGGPPRPGGPSSFPECRSRRREGTIFAPIVGALDHPTIPQRLWVPQYALWHTQAVELQAGAEDHAKFVVTGTASAYLSPRYEIQLSSGRVRYPSSTS